MEGNFTTIVKCNISDFGGFVVKIGGFLHISICNIMFIDVKK